MSPLLAEIDRVAERLVPIDDIRRFIDLIYQLDVSELGDDDFEHIEQLIDRAVRLLAQTDETDLVARLRIAREGIEQGVAADPYRRPSLEDMRRYVADHL